MVVFGLFFGVFWVFGGVFGVLLGLFGCWFAVVLLLVCLSGCGGFGVSPLAVGFGCIREYVGALMLGLYHRAVYCARGGAGGVGV